MIFKNTQSNLFLFIINYNIVFIEWILYIHNNITYRYTAAINIIFTRRYRVYRRDGKSFFTFYFFVQQPS